VGPAIPQPPSATTLEPDRSLGGVARPTENVLPSVQLVLRKPNVAPAVEKGYEIKLSDKNQTVTLRPIDKIDPNYQELGGEIGKTEFRVLAGNGIPYNYTVFMREGGMEILPSNLSAIQYVENNRDAVIRDAVKSVVNNIKVEPSLIRTIFIDLR
jgi:hypothetical protein